MAALDWLYGASEATRCPDCKLPMPVGRREPCSSCHIEALIKAAQEREYR